MLHNITKRNIQIALGGLWFLDGALQLQHQMFTANFANDVITPAADGQPRFISGPMHFFIHVFLLQPVICNALIALVQLGLGVLILKKSTAKFGLTASIFWGLFVWYIGEGLGGLATGQTSLLIGAPGAALIYAIIALGVLPSAPGDDKDRSRPAVWLAFVWAILWLGGAVLQFVNGQNTTAELSSMIAGMADGAPGWLAALDIHTASFLQQHTGNWFIGMLIILQAIVGFCVLMRRRVRTAAIAIGIVVSLIFWVSGQSCGMYYSGLATDPNTAPLIILLGIAILGTKEIDLEIV